MQITRRCVLTSLVLLGIMPGGVLAQGAALAGLRGNITTTDGAPIELARVEIRDPASGRSATTVTDASGRYAITGLLAGDAYAVSVEAFGYAARGVERIQLQAGAIRRLDFVLQPSALALEEVTARANADPRFDTRRSGAATTVDRAELAAHPTLERNVVELAALAPMAVRTRDGMSIAGQNARFNALQIDGARYQDMFGAAADGAPGGLANARPLPLDAVGEFQVLVAPFDVRHSGFTGGLLNVITRGGTNRWEAGGFAHYRDATFMGDLDADGQTTRAPGFRNALAGFTVGGPLLRDRIHVFAAVEAERRRSASSGYNIGSSDAFAARIAPDSADRLATILRDVHGIDAGAIGQVTLENPRENVFLRVDWQQGRHRAMLRHNYAAARRDVEPNRTAVRAYELGSQLHRLTSSAHAGTLELVSSLGSRWSNELLFSVQHISDRATPASTSPAIEVDITSAFDTLRVQRRVRAGGRIDAQANRVTQSGIEIRNALTGALGEHLLTVGGGAELMRFRSVWTPNPRGLYYFHDLDALEQNRPTHFERTITLDGSDDETRFNAGHVSAFVQDEWSATRGLTIQLGVRMDLPVLRDRPELNQALLDSLGASTATLPGTGPLWSPRLALNWQNRAALRTQLRGGAGLFAGRPAYSWIADAYAQTGLRTAFLICDSTATPQLVSGTAPSACAGEAAGAGLRSSPITLFAGDFRFPQDLRVAAGIDQMLPLGITVSADVILATAQRQIFLRDINLGDAITDPMHEDGYSDGFGYRRRSVFGVPTIDGFDVVRRAGGFGPVIELADDAQNRALAASLELSRTSRTLAARVAYTFTRSLDVQSLTARDAAANFASVAVGGDPNTPRATRSSFDRPHRVLLSLSSRVRDTELSMLYVGESGTPYTYVYGLDINGDGAPGPGVTDSYNDPLYVTELVSSFPGGLASAIAFQSLVDIEPCLARERNQVMQRNECRGPATHRLDLRASHTLRVRGTSVRFVADLLNALRLVGSSRGIVRTVPSLVPILGVQSPRTTNPLTPAPHTLPLQAWYAGPRERTPSGGLRALAPWTIDPAASRWQAQLGIEVRH